MKKLLLISLIIFSTITVFAQHTRESTGSDEKFVLKINPLSIFLITANINAEYKVSSSIGAQLGVGYTAINIGDLKYEGYRLTPEIRFYVKKNAISGFYVAPYFRYQHYQLTDGSNDKFLYQSFGGGLSFGWQKIFSSGFVFDIFLGPSHNSGKFTATEGSGSDPSVAFGINGTGIRTGMTLGFAF